MSGQDEAGGPAAPTGTPADTAARIRVEVAAALPERQFVLALELAAGTTLIEAVKQADLSRRLPGLEVDETRLGIYGRLRPPETLLEDGDRVEVYRPLTADPKEIRRQLADVERAQKKSRSGSSGGWRTD